MPGQDQIHYKLDAHRLVYRIITYKILKCSRENVSIVTFPHGGRTGKVNYRDIAPKNYPFCNDTQGIYYALLNDQCLTCQYSHTQVNIT